jgi:hypothetical protein
VSASGRSTLIALLALLGAGLLLLLGGSAIVLLILGYGHEAMSGVLPLLSWCSWPPRSCLALAAPARAADG